MKVSNLSWPTVVVIVAALAALTIMGAMHVDTSAILLVLASVGIGGGAVGVTAALSAMKVNINGNVTNLIALLEKSVNYLANAQPVSPPATLGDEHTPAPVQVGTSHMEG